MCICMYVYVYIHIHISIIYSSACVHIEIDALVPPVYHWSICVYCNGRGHVRGSGVMVVLEVEVRATGEIYMYKIR